MKNQGAGIRPVGHVILVLPLEVDVKSAGGIIMATAGQTRREEMGQTEATVVSLGNTAYADQAEAWCQPGDRVVFARYAGTERAGSDGKMYRLINDLDVKGVLENE
jgi:co-chaperonin GroES (HSP10)